MNNGYKIIPELGGQIDRVAFISSPYRDDITLLESFLETILDVSIMLLAWEPFFIDRDKPKTTTSSLKEFSDSHDMVDLYVIDTDGDYWYTAIWPWARNTLWPLQNRKKFTIIPSGRFLFSNLWERSNKYVDPKIFHEIPFGKNYVPFNFSQDSILRWTNNADIIVTSEVVIVDFSSLDHFIYPNDNLLKKYFKNPSLVADKIEKELDEWTEIIRKELSSYINNQEVILLPIIGGCYYDLDTALIPYAPKEFFIGPYIPKNVLKRLLDNEIKLTEYPLPTQSLQLGGASDTNFYACDINVITEERDGGKIAYLPNRPNPWSKLEYEAYQKKWKYLWQSKGFEVKYLESPLDENVGLHCVFQIIKRLYDT